MRSKEIEQSIKVIKKDIKDWKEMLEIEMEFEDDIDEQQVAYLTQQITAYETLLNYISELEKENKFLRDENNIYRNETVGKKRIRDKIKELEEDKQTILQAIEEAKESKDEEFLKYNREILYRINGEISVLKELLEGE